MTNTTGSPCSVLAARFAGVLTVVVAIMVVFASAPSLASAAVSCDRVAAPSGSDSNSGTLTSPYLTVQKLDDSLTAGQTGCLRAGTYASGMQTNFATPAVTITSYPGERATVAGFPYITGTGDTFSNLNFDLNKTGDVVALCQGGIGRGASITFPFEIEASNVTVRALRRDRRSVRAIGKPRAGNRRRLQLLNLRRRDHE